MCYALSENAMLKTKLAAIAGLAAAADASVAVAHHSYAAFDLKKSITIVGAVRAFEMINPHSFLWVTVKADGGDQTWALEGGGVAAIQRAGLTKSALKIGDPITVDLHPLRDGRTGGQLIRMKLANGKTIGGGNGGGAGPGGPAAGGPAAGGPGGGAGG